MLDRAQSRGSLIEPVDDQGAPGIPFAVVGLRDPLVAGEPRRVEIARGPRDADWLAVSKFLDVGEPRAARVLQIEHRVDPEADKARERRLQLIAQEIFVER